MGHHEAFELCTELHETVVDGLEGECDVLLPCFDLVGDFEAFLEDADDESLGSGHGCAIGAEEATVDALSAKRSKMKR